MEERKRAARIFLVQAIFRTNAHMMNYQNTWRVANMGTLAKILAKALGKKLAQATGYGVKTVSKKIPMKEAIKDLKTDSELSETYVRDLVSRAKGESSLNAIREYLMSTRNHLNPELTKSILDSIARKLGSVKQYFVESNLEDHAHTILDLFI